MWHLNKDLREMKGNCVIESQTKSIQAGRTALAKALGQACASMSQGIVRGQCGWSQVIQGERVVVRKD